MTDLAPGGLGEEEPLAEANLLVCPECSHLGDNARALGLHRYREHGVAGRRKKPKRDRPPASVNVQVGPKTAPRGAKKDADLERLEAKARQWCEFMAVGLVVMGQSDDAVDVQKMAPQWAAAVKGVGQHEEWLRKLAQGGESSDRVLAWVQLAFVTGAMLTPILLRHHALPPGIANALGQVMTIEVPHGAPVPDAAAA